MNDELLNEPRREVQSSNIKSVGYNDNQETLIIEFHRGGIFSYHPVSVFMYNDMINAPSVGKFFHENIRKREGITCENIG